MISQIIASLKEHNLTNDKKRILLSHKDNDTLRLLFKMTYDSQYTYWIRAEMPTRSGSNILTKEILEDVLYHLHGRAVTGNAARDYLENILSQLTKEEQQVLVNCINRDMNCKVSIALINGTWKDLIYSFPVMLAGKFNEKTAKPFYAAETFDTTGECKMVVQCKCDGGRCTYVTSSKAGYSRNASQLLTHDHFDFMNTMFEGYAVDGELLSINLATGKFHDRKTSNGLYTKAVRGTISKEEAATLHFVVWDLIPLNEFEARKGTTTYKDRFAKLESIVNGQHQFSSRISLVQSKLINSVHAAQVFYDEMLERGEEGAMLKLLDSVWESTRSDQVLKLKEEKEATLRCIGVTPHNKKPGQIGSLELASECGKLNVSCGSGLNDNDRLKNPREFIDQLIDVKYNALIKAKNRTSWSMFLPIFKNIRYDVTEADTLEKLQ